MMRPQPNRTTSSTKRVYITCRLCTPIYEKYNRCSERCIQRTKFTRVSMSPVRAQTAKKSQKANLFQFSSRKWFPFWVTGLITHRFIPFSSHQYLRFLSSIVDIPIHFVATSSTNTIAYVSLGLKT